VKAAVEFVGCFCVFYCRLGGVLLLKSMVGVMEDVCLRWFSELFRSIDPFLFFLCGISR